MQSLAYFDAHCIPRCVLGHTRRETQILLLSPQRGGLARYGCRQAELFDVRTHHDTLIEPESSGEVATTDFDPSMFSF